MDTNELVAQIRAIETEEDMQRVDELIRAEPGPMAPEVQAALLDRLRQMAVESQTKREEVISVLRVHGVDYPLTDWLTPANYAKQFDIQNVATIVNWIKRGIIPEENVKEIPELGLRLVRAVEYNPRGYERTPERQKDAS